MRTEFFDPGDREGEVVFVRILRTFVRTQIVFFSASEGGRLGGELL